MESSAEFTDPDPEASKRLSLLLGQKYRIIRSFTDADGRLHQQGKEWTFIGSRFSRFENEYIIYTRSKDILEKSFGLICDEDKQYEIVRHLSEYIAQI